MARCAVCYKKNVFGNNVAHSGVKTGRLFRANLHKFHGEYYCTKCVRIVKKEIAAQTPKKAPAASGNPQ